jgi:Neuraminidase (sialidase)
LIVVLALGCIYAVRAEKEPTPTRATVEASAVHPKLPLQRHLTLTPSPENPRNSEGDFIQLKDGRWLFIYTHFTASADDHARAYLASRESSDGGRTWSDKDKIIVANEGGFNVMSVSLLRLKSGEIALFYLRKNSLQDCRPVVRFSRDEAAMWSEPIDCITEDISYYVLHNSRVIQLKNGRLVMPTGLHRLDKGKLQPGEIVTFLSDDRGRTWHRSKSVLKSDFTEPCVVEVKKNRVLMTIRTKKGCQYLSESKDNGETWSTPAPSGSFSPEAPSTLARIPSTGDLLLIWDDLCDKPLEYRQHQPPIRTPFAVAISKDGGRTWQKTKLVEDQVGHGYCYTAVAFAGDRVLLGYCAHKSAYGLETTQISSFNVRDLYR